jgi:hypothetical protein
MADTTTTNYGFTQPEVGGSNDTWGDKLNADLASIDTLIKELRDDVDAIGAGILAADFTNASVMTKTSAGAMAPVALAASTVLGRRATGEIDDVPYATLKTDLALNNVDNYSRAQLKIYFDTLYTPVGGSGGVISGQPLDATLTEVAVTGIGANQIWVGNGTDSLTKKTISTYMQGALATAIDALAIDASDLTANGYLKLTNGFMLQWGSTSLSSEQVKTTSYEQAYSVFSVCVGSGGPSSHSEEGDIRVTACTKTGFTASNTSGGTATFFWIAIGK